MLDFNKVLISKIISLIIAISFLLADISYVGAYQQGSLRVPMGQVRAYKRVKEIEETYPSATVAPTAPVAIIDTDTPNETAGPAAATVAKIEAVATAVTGLQNQLKTAGLLGEAIPLYDIDDSLTEKLYRGAVEKAPAETRDRDLTSWQQISGAVKAHLEKYPKRTLIIVCGAGRHIWGALAGLEESKGIGYLSTTNRKLDVKVIGNNLLDIDIGPNETKTEAAVRSLNVQLYRDVGVIKYLGYKSLEEFIQERHNRINSAQHIMIGLEETGMHALYFDRGQGLYRYLEDFLGQYQPVSILYIGEDLYVDNLQKDHQRGYSGKMSARERFLLKAKNMRIPVEFAMFGKSHSAAGAAISIQQGGSIANSLTQRMNRDVQGDL